MRDALQNALKITAATFITVLAGLYAFVFLGGLLPIWTMMAIYGRQQVEDSPGHGVPILLVTAPVAACIVLGGALPFWILVNKILSRFPKSVDCGKAGARITDHDT
jgi:hypothetical protein